MRFAVELYFDPSTEASLKALWGSLSQADVSSLLLEIGSRPHVSLADFEQIDPAILCAELETFAEKTSSLPVTLSAVGVFPTTEGVVYMAPVVTQELLTLHMRFHERLNALCIASSLYYRPGHWVPHCTCAAELPPQKILAAVEICRRSDVFNRPARLTAIGLIEYRPARELCVFPLGVPG
jgi:2'-5' RNA ligase